MYFYLFIYKMPTYQYATGQNVSHNGNCCTVFRLRDVDGAPAYLLREDYFRNSNRQCIRV